MYSYLGIIFEDASDDAEFPRETYSLIVNGTSKIDDLYEIMKEMNDDKDIKILGSEFVCETTKKKAKEKIEKEVLERYNMNVTAAMVINALYPEDKQEKKFGRGHEIFFD